MIKELIRPKKIPAFFLLSLFFFGCQYSDSHIELSENEFFSKENIRLEEFEVFKLWELVQKVPTESRRSILLMDTIRKVRLNAYANAQKQVYIENSILIINILIMFRHQELALWEIENVLKDNRYNIEKEKKQQLLTLKLEALINSYKNNHHELAIKENLIDFFNSKGKEENDEYYIKQGIYGKMRLYYHSNYDSSLHYLNKMSKFYKDERGYRYSRGLLERQLHWMKKWAGNTIDDNLEYAQLGVSFRNAGKLDTAEQLLIKVLEDKTDGYFHRDIIGNINLGKLYFLKSDFDQAHDYLELAYKNLSRFDHRLYLDETLEAQLNLYSSNENLELLNLTHRRKDSLSQKRILEGKAFYASSTRDLAYIEFLKLKAEKSKVAIASVLIISIAVCCFFFLKVWLNQYKERLLIKERDEIILLNQKLSERNTLLYESRNLIQKNLAQKKQELKTKMILGANVNMTFNNLMHDLAQLKFSSKLKQDVGNLIKRLKSMIQSNRYTEGILKQIEILDLKHIKRLRYRHPELSTTELKYCSFISYGLTNKEIAHILKIAPKSV